MFFFGKKIVMYKSNINIHVSKRVVLSSNIKTLLLCLYVLCNLKKYRMMNNNIISPISIIFYFHTECYDDSPIVLNLSPN